MCKGTLKTQYALYMFRPLLLPSSWRCITRMDISRYSSLWTGAHV